MLQCQVTAGVPVTVVDHLEGIQVHDRDIERLPERPVRATHGLEEGAAVGDVGEGVGVRSVPQQSRRPVQGGGEPDREDQDRRGHDRGHDRRHDHAGHEGRIVGAVQHQHHRRHQGHRRDDREARHLHHEAGHATPPNLHEHPVLGAPQLERAEVRLGLAVLAVDRAGVSGGRCHTVPSTDPATA